MKSVDPKRNTSIEPISSQTLLLTIIESEQERGRERRSAGAKAMVQFRTGEREMDLIHCTNEMNVNVPQLADTLFERTTNSSWVVVFKALITTHHLMMYGNERFIQYLASRNTLFNLNNFLDKGALQGYDMSTFIRRYSRYLNEKALSYRLVAVDFTKMKRGIDGVMRTMNTEKLVKTLPIIQNQLDALLDFQANPNELTNGVINAAFMLLFKDSIRLFAAYNEGVINLLEKYFDMKKNQCKDALDIYKKFLYRMTKLSEFLKVAEQVGIDQGDIPDLTQTTRGSYLAPSSLLEALEQHLASLEGKKTKELSADNRANTLSNAVSSLSNTGMSFSSSSSRMDEKEKQQALEEEQARLQALKNQHLKEISMQTPSTSPSTQSMGSVNNHTAGMDLFTNTTSPPSTNSMPNLTSDLFDLQPAFVPAVQCTPISTVSNAWGGLESSTLHPMASMPTMNVDFDAVFGANASNSDVKPSAGDLLKPAVTVHSQAPVMPPHTASKLLANDLDSSLANLVGNLHFGGTPGKKSDMQWTQPGERKLTGGTNWQSKTMSSTTAWSPAPLPPAAMPPAAMPVPHLAPAPMAFPMTTPQVPVYGMVPPQLGQMGGVPVMTQQPMLYNQPVLRPTNPFTPIPGAQMQFM
ncbi:phosphatidylinositol-binding clathrin assembly protein-like isoform X1 [Sinocyclocheilus anshuiensis]|uniref:phosphatidylinositol-binding clathrin assembly protein-like isoform X1 n=1 Tax=Sinocyclocheilus anshuiensis TaxID=1608454 RepID=UPI0007B9F806|nr:PREDICTED: phosphatidylinositol-binding clathrin assembly protein-like isoform X1 [Sinocyclocheilus anshuiensis]